MMQEIIWADGGCLQNGSDAAKAYGSYLVEGEGLGPRYFDYGKRTNNEAEYLIILDALSESAHTEVLIKIDSALVFHQTRGEWKVKEPRLQVLCIRLQKLLREKQSRLEWVEGEAMKKVLGH